MLTIALVLMSRTLGFAKMFEHPSKVHPKSETHLIMMFRFYVSSANCSFKLPGTN